MNPAKHVYMRIKDVPPIRKTIEAPVEAPSGLDVALTRLKEKGAKVLNFWRSNAGWTIKVMVPRT